MIKPAFLFLFLLEAFGGLYADGKVKETPLPKLAILCTFENKELNYFSNLLHAEFFNQNTFELVDREKNEKIFAELSLVSSLGKSKSSKFGKIKGADYLLIVMGREGENMDHRLIYLPEGKVLYEKKVVLREDPELSAVEIREETLKSVKGNILVDNSMTVGIGAIINYSGSPRADAAGVELSQLLRDVFAKESWAYTLERQYPSNLLSEMELSREGFASGHSSALPQADLVLTGTYKEKNDKVLIFTIHLLVNLEKSKMSEVLDVEVRGKEDYTLLCKEVLRKAIEMRDLSKKGVVDKKTSDDEIDRLKKAARYVMLDFRSFSSVPTKRTENDNLLALRLFQNVLLLNENDVLASIHLAQCKFIRFSVTRKIGRYFFYEGTSVYDLKKRSEERETYHREVLGFIEEAEKLVKKHPSELSNQFYSKIFQYCFRDDRRWDVEELNPLLIKMANFLKKKSIYIPWNWEYVGMKIKRMTGLPFFGTAEKLIENVDSDPMKLSSWIYSLVDRSQKKKFLEKYSGHSHDYVKFLANKVFAGTLDSEGNSECLIYYKKAAEYNYKLLPFFERHKISGGLLGRNANNLVHLFKKYKEPYCDYLEPYWPEWLKSGGKYKKNTPSEYQYLEGFKSSKQDKKGYLCAKTVAERKGFQNSYWSEYFKNRLDGKLSSPKPILKFKGTLSVSGVVGQRVWFRDHYGMCAFDPKKEKIVPLIGVGVKKAMAIAANDDYVMIGTLKDGVYFYKHNGTEVRHVPDGHKDLPPGYSCYSLASYDNIFYGLFRDREMSYLVKREFPQKTYQLIAPKIREHRKFLDSISGPTNRIYLDQHGISTIDNFSRGIHISEQNGEQKIKYVRGSYFKKEEDKIYFRKVFKGKKEKYSKLDGQVIDIFLNYEFRLILSCEMNENYVWLGTRNGLFQINRSTNECVSLLLKLNIFLKSLHLINHKLYAISKGRIYKFKVPK